MDNPVTSEHERARLALPGQRTDNGAFATFLIIADQHGGWSFQPHGASALGVRVEDDTRWHEGHPGGCPAGVAVASRMHPFTGGECPGVAFLGDFW